MIRKVAPRHDLPGEMLTTEWKVNNEIAAYGFSLVVIGNPPTDKEGSWFEKCCSSKLYNVIRIDADSTPNFTGELSTYLY